MEELMLEVIEKLNQIDEYRENLPSKMSEVDSKISDVYHYIENNTMNAKSAYRLCKELKGNLLERRKLKRNQSLLDLFENGKDKLKRADNRTMLKHDLFKEKKNLDTEYKFRVYNKEEFINKIEG